MGFRLLFASLILFLSACASKPPMTPMEPVSIPAANPMTKLESQLGMNRASDDLGFAEKRFNPCELGLSSTSQCGTNYLTVVQFQLLCRDSEGTIQEIPQTFPIHAPELRWKLGGKTGGTATNAKGYGRFSVIGHRPLRGQRLILFKGSQFVAVTVSDLTKIVLPKPWCT